MLVICWSYVDLESAVKDSKISLEKFFPEDELGLIQMVFESNWLLPTIATTISQLEGTRIEAKVGKLKFLLLLAKDVAIGTSRLIEKFGKS